MKDLLPYLLGAGLVGAILMFFQKGGIKPDVFKKRLKDISRSVRAAPLSDLVKRGNSILSKRRDKDKS